MGHAAYQDTQTREDGLHLRTVQVKSGHRHAEPPSLAPAPALFGVATRAGYPEYQPRSKDAESDVTSTMTEDCRAPRNATIGPHYRTSTARKQHHCKKNAPREGRPRLHLEVNGHQQGQEVCTLDEGGCGENDGHQAVDQDSPGVISPISTTYRPGDGGTTKSRPLRRDAAVSVAGPIRNTTSASTPTQKKRP